MKAMKISKEDFVSLCVVFLILLLLNVHFETFEFEKETVVKIDSYEEFKIGDNFNDITCSKPIKACYYHYGFGASKCPDDLTEYIQYEWLSNEVDSKESKYLVFRGNGYCTIKYPKTRVRLTWL